MSSARSSNGLCGSTRHDRVQQQDASRLETSRDVDVSATPRRRALRARVVPNVCLDLEAANLFVDEMSRLPMMARELNQYSWV
jgi:hypothetical protein